MKQHEREYFVSRIRSGYYTVNVNGFDLKVYPPTIEDELQANAKYIEVYDECVDEGLMLEEDMVNVIIKMGMWTADKEKKIQGLPKDIERLNVDLYNNRFNRELREKMRSVMRAGKEQLSKLALEKMTFRENTCEGQAILAKSLDLIGSCTYLGNELFNFNGVDMKTVWYSYCNMFLEESAIRDLANGEPWKSLWVLSKNNLYKLFTDNGRELTTDQRNIIVWSRTYDNISESHECPPDDIIKDDEMLDGWFIVQRQKREKERMEAEIDQNPKLQNADEVFVMAKTKDDVERVSKLNDPHTAQVKKDRLRVIQEKGSAKQSDFLDEKLKLRQQYNEQFKGKFGNG